MNVVTAAPTGHVLSAENKTKTIKINLSASRNDETFVEIKDNSVIYSSSNTEVAKVDEHGVVTAASGGISTITATVTDGDITLSDSFAVVVEQSLGLIDNIFLDNIALRGFMPTQTNYFASVENLEILPIVTAEASVEVVVEITQATALSKVATVKATKGSVEQIYTITFIQGSEYVDLKALSEVEVKNIFDIKREDDTAWKMVSGKGLEITTQKGDLYRTNNTAKNIFLYDAPGDWIAETKMTFDPIPNKNYQQGALLSYSNDDNFLKLHYEYTSKNLVQFSGEVEGMDYNNFKKDLNIQELWFRLEKNNEVYTASFSTDGEEYVQMGSSKEQTMQDVKIGLAAFNSGIDDPIKVTYEYLKIMRASKCSCVLTDLNFDEEDLAEIGPITANGLSQELMASAILRGNCDMPEHDQSKVIFSFDIKENGINTANATISNHGILSADTLGKVNIMVTASIADVLPISKSVVFDITGAITTDSNLSNVIVTADQTAKLNNLVTVRISGVSQEQELYSFAVKTDESTPQNVDFFTASEGEEYRFTMPKKPVVIKVIVSEDKTDLIAAISDASSKMESAYTFESWAEFKTVLAQAIETSQNPEASSLEIATVTTDLCAAMDNLQMAESVEDLRSMISEVEQLLEETISKLYNDSTNVDDRANGNYSGSKYLILEEANQSAKSLMEEIDSNNSGYSIQRSEEKDLDKKESAVEESAVEESAVEESAVEEPAVEESVVEESAVEGSAVEGSAVEGSAVEGSAVEESTDKKELEVKDEKANSEVYQTQFYYAAVQMEKNNVDAYSDTELSEEQKVQVVNKIRALTKMTEEFCKTKVTVATLELDKRIQQVENMDESVFVVEDWQLLQTTIESGKELLSAGNYTMNQIKTMAVKIDQEVSALKRQYRLELIVGVGGTATASEKITHGENLEIIVIADKNQGYSIDSVMVNDQFLAPNQDDKYIISNVESNLKIVVTFKRVVVAKLPTESQVSSVEISGSDDVINGITSVEVKDTTEVKKKEFNKEDRKVETVLDFDIKGNKINGDMTVRLKVVDLLLTKIKNGQLEIYLKDEKGELKSVPVSYEKTNGVYYLEFNTNWLETLFIVSVSSEGEKKPVYSNNFESSSSGSGGSNRADSSAGAVATVAPLKPINMLQAEKLYDLALAKAKSLNESKVLMQLFDYSEISLEIMQKLTKKAKIDGVDLRISARCKENEATTGFLIFNPADATSSILLGLSTTNPRVVKTKKLFEKWFNNEIFAVELPQVENFEMQVEIAIKVPANMKKDDLRFFAYDAKTNQYRAIVDAKYTIDNKGYVHFLTSFSGTIVISDGSMQRKTT